MNTKNITITDEGIFIECPHCLVCSTKLSMEEFALVDSGQYMVEVCQVCGREIILNG